MRIINMNAKKLAQLSVVISLGLALGAGSANAGTGGN